MDDTKELISESTVRAVVLAIGIGGPILGAAVGLVVGVLRRAVLPALWRGLGIGLLGLICLAMWHLYNAVLSWQGFDSVRGFLLNVGIFLVVGILAGWAAGVVAFRCRPRRPDG
jgi:hypothetical protein